MNATGLRKPSVGLIVSYAYLWKSEALASLEEGRKIRPCLVLFMRDRLTYVLPITHSLPHEPETAVEVPALVRRFLGLDDEPQWIVLNECNTFDWPGYDIRVEPQYGHIPPALYDRIRNDVARRIREARFAMTDRN